MRGVAAASVMRAAWPLVALVLAGCLGPPAPGTSPTSDCATGQRAVFLSTVSGGGLVAQEQVPRLVEVGRDGELRLANGHMQPGSGRVVGAVAPLNESVVLGMLARRNISVEARDYNVTQAARRTLTAQELSTLCRDVVAAFPTLKESYPDDRGCADEGSTTWDVSIRQGDKTVFADACASDTGSFGPLLAELDGLVANATR